jgi:hypothetical protein
MGKQSRSRISDQQVESSIENDDERVASDEVLQRLIEGGRR